MVSKLFSKSRFSEVKIGSQIWMNCNLNVEKFRNGDSIHQAKSFDEWQDANTNQYSAWCYYDFNQKNGKVYGKLYNFHAVADKRGIAPEGWHIPTDSDWQTLEEFLGMTKDEVEAREWRGENQADKLKAKEGWKITSTGQDEFGFKALPGGDLWKGLFSYLKSYGFWWTASEIDKKTAWSRGMCFHHGKIGRYANDKGIGYSVRCVKN